MTDDPPEDREPAPSGRRAADEELVLRHVRALHDPQRYEAACYFLFTRYVAYLQRFLRSKGAKPGEAEDLTQETFFRVFRAGATFETLGSFEAYLRQAAHNRFRNARREETAVKRHQPEDSLDAWIEAHADGVPPPDEPRDRGALGAVLEDEQKREVAKALGTLPTAMRNCLVLRIFHEMKYREIADLLGIEIGTVKAHLHQGRSRLSTLLAPYFGRGGPKSPGEAGA